ncbi:cystathionine gamma-lyase, partial [Xanthomonas citri pv. citri]|nr:cystathionine gamma-lyase [Xanthomonas citri pv. citri]
LEVRFARMCASAQAVAELAAGHPAVRAVVYPGLADHPDAEVVARQMTAAGGLVGLRFADAAAAERFIAAAQYVVPQTSFGGTHTAAERRARWGDDVPDGFVRLSVGVE